MHFRGCYPHWISSPRDISLSVAVAGPVRPHTRPPTPMHYYTATVCIECPSISLKFRWIVCPCPQASYVHTRTPTSRAYAHVVESVLVAHITPKKKRRLAREEEEEKEEEAEKNGLEDGGGAKKEEGTGRTAQWSRRVVGGGEEDEEVVEGCEKTGVAEGDAAAAGGGNGDGEWRWWWQDALACRLRACICTSTHTRACEYRDSSLKIQMEYRAFEEREVPRGVRGGGL